MKIKSKIIYFNDMIDRIIESKTGMILGWIILILSIIELIGSVIK